MVWNNSNKVKNVANQRRTGEYYGQYSEGIETLRSGRGLPSPGAQLNALDVDAHSVPQPLHNKLLGRRYDGYDFARPTQPSGPSPAVYVALPILWQIEVEDVRDLRGFQQAFVLI